MIVKHPTNCDCEYEFPHTFIVNERLTEIDGVWSKVVKTFVVCRVCNHWIDARMETETRVMCPCPFRCHSELGGTTVDIKAFDAVN